MAETNQVISFSPPLFLSLLCKCIFMDNSFIIFFFYSVPKFRNQWVWIVQMANLSVFLFPSIISWWERNLDIIARRLLISAQDMS